jgi:hypothetical protein
MREAGLGCAVCAPPFDRGTLRSNTLRATNSVKSHGGMNHHDAIDSSQCGYQSASPGDQGCPWGSRCERGRPLKSWGPQRSFVRDALSRHALETNGLAQFDCGCAWLCAYLKFYHSPFPPAPFFPPLPFMPFVDGDGWIVVHGRFAVPTEDDGAELAGLSGNRLPNKQSPPAPVIPPVAQRLPRRSRRGGSACQRLFRRQLRHRAWTALCALLLVRARAAALQDDPVGREWWLSGGRRSAVEDVEETIRAWALP